MNQLAAHAPATKMAIAASAATWLARTKRGGNPYAASRRRTRRLVRELEAAIRTTALSRKHSGAYSRGRHVQGI
jgi:hypothetical protein